MAASAAVAVAPEAMTATSTPQEGSFATAAVNAIKTAAARASGHSAAPAVAPSAEIAPCLPAMPTHLTTETAAAHAVAATTTAPAATTTTTTAPPAAAAAPAVTAPAPADIPPALHAQATSETVNSTLMGIALLAYLQGSAAKHETDGGGHRSSGAPSSSQGGGLAATAAAAAAAAHQYVPPRRYQRMSPVDNETPTEPLTRILAVIKGSQSKPQYTCKRVLSSSTYLHRVHVNAAMSTNLLPDYGGHTSGRSPPRNHQETRKPTPSGGAPTCRKPNTVIFRRRVRMLDEQDREWLITYESLCSAGQRHTRFSAGWAALCKANDFRVGQTIVFSRWGKRDSGVVVVQRES